MHRFSRAFRSTFSLHRALGALLVALAVGLVTGGMLGFAVAAETSDAPAALSGTFGVPVPNVGDHGRYTYSEQAATMGSTPLSEKTLLEFEVLADRSFRDGHGTLHNAHVLKEVTDDDRNPQRDVRVLLDSSFSTRIAVDHVTNVSETSQETIFPMLPATETQWYFQDQYDFDKQRGPGDPNLPCGLANHLQGKAIRLNEPVLLFDKCHPSHISGFYNGATVPSVFRAVGTSTVGDLEAMVFRREAFSDGRYSFPQIDAWFSSKVPYALRIEVGRGSGVVEVLRLAAFSAGQTPIRLELPQVPAAPELAWAPSPPWGMNDSGVDHPFPLSVAYERTRNDPAYSALRDFLADHPKAFVQSAHTVEWRRDDEVTRQWYLSLTDGAEGVTVCPYQKIQFPTGNVPGQKPVADPKLPPEYGYEVEYDEVLGRPLFKSWLLGGTCEWQGRLLDPSFAPKQMITAASARARWEAFASPEYLALGANAYGFDVCRYDPCEPGDFILDVGHRRWIGTNHPNGEPTPFQSQSSLWSSSYLDLDETGWTRNLWESSQQSTEETQPKPPKDLPADSSSSPARIAAASSEVRLWAVPTKEYVAGAGLLALLSGFLYWLWPTMKGAATVSLFSRLEKPKALEHPLRAQIQALVEAEPGIHFQEIARRTGQGQGATQHHLTKLTQLGLIAAQVGQGYTCYFPKGRVDRRLMAAAPVLKSPGARSVLAAIAAIPGSTGSAVAERAGLTRQAVDHHLRRLKAMELITIEHVGRELRILPTELARAAIQLRA